MTVLVLGFYKTFKPVAAERLFSVNLFGLENVLREGCLGILEIIVGSPMKKALGNTDIACMSENVMFMSGLLGLEGDSHNLLHVLTLHISRRSIPRNPTGEKEVSSVFYLHIQQKCVVNYTLGQPLATKPKG